MDAAKKNPAAPPTQDQIRALLEASDRAVEEAILRLHARQTQDEQAARDTKHRNHRGFSAAHARTGSKYAGWIIGMRANGSRPGDCLKRGDHKAKARDLALRYVRQLHEEAMAKWTARAEAQARIEADSLLPSLDDLELVNRQAQAMHGHRPVGDCSRCSCGGEWLGNDCETRMVQAADMEDAAQAADAKAHRDYVEEASRGFKPGMTARLTTNINGFPALPMLGSQAVQLREGQACLVMETQLNPGHGPLYMTCALFGAQRLWVPTTSLKHGT